MFYVQVPPLCHILEPPAIPRTRHIFVGAVQTRGKVHLAPGRPAAVAGAGLEGGPEDRDAAGLSHGHAGGGRRGDRLPRPGPAPRPPQEGVCVRGGGGCGAPTQSPNSEGCPAPPTHRYRPLVQRQPGRFGVVRQDRSLSQQSGACRLPRAGMFLPTAALMEESSGLGDQPLGGFSGSDLPLPSWRCLCIEQHCWQCHTYLRHCRKMSG